MSQWVEPLEQGRPERRPEPRNVVGAPGAEEAFDLARERIGAAQQMAEGMAYQPRATLQGGELHRRLDAILVEGNDGLAKIGLGGVIEELLAEQPSRRRQDGPKARPQDRDCGQSFGGKDTAVGVSTNERHERQRLASCPHRRAIAAGTATLLW